MASQKTYKQRLLENTYRGLLKDRVRRNLYEFACSYFGEDAKIVSGKDAIVVQPPSPLDNVEEANNLYTPFAHLLEALHKADHGKFLAYRVVRKFYGRMATLPEDAASKAETWREDGKYYLVVRKAPTELKEKRRDQVELKLKELLGSMGEYKFGEIFIDEEGKIQREVMEGDEE